MDPVFSSEILFWAKKVCNLNPPYVVHDKTFEVDVDRGDEIVETRNDSTASQGDTRNR